MNKKANHKIRLLTLCVVILTIQKKLTKLKQKMMLKFLKQIKNKIKKTKFNSQKNLLKVQCKLSISNFKAKYNRINKIWIK